MRLSIQLPSKEEHIEPGKSYRHTKEVRIRTGAQIILPAAEQQLPASQIAGVERKDDQMVHNRLKRYNIGLLTTRERLRLISSVGRVD